MFSSGKIVLGLGTFATNMLHNAGNQSPSEPARVVRELFYQCVDVANLFLPIPGEQIRYLRVWKYQTLATTAKIVHLNHSVWKAENRHPVSGEE
jgi:hypothetical protein